jgi:hypothetical protein
MGKRSSVVYLVLVMVCSFKHNYAADLAACAVAAQVGMAAYGLAAQSESTRRTSDDPAQWPA